MSHGPQPRAGIVVPPLGPDDLGPPDDVDEVMARLPAVVREAVGTVHDVRRLAESACNLPLLLETDAGRKVLKVAQGPYRSSELWIEYSTCLDLEGGTVPVPRVETFGQDGDLSYMLRAYVSGTPLADALHGPEAGAAFMEMTRVLGSVHLNAAPGAHWERWIEATLAAARHNLKVEVLDPAEFSEGEAPEAMLRRLEASVPPSDRLTLIHGDFRPKNLLWRGRRIVGVIDWAFADVGDPYYDYAIALEYGGPTASSLRFLDPERLRWMHDLSKFINV